MLKARDIMSVEPPYCALDASIKDISQRFVDENLSGMLVVDAEKRLLGVITESDLIDQQAKLHLPTAMAVFDMIIPLGEEKFEKELARMQAMMAENLMSMHVKTVDVNADLAELASLMGEADIHHLPVLEGEFVAGMISRRDIIRALARQIS